MDFQHRLMRATLAGIGERAIQHIRRDFTRGVRNLIDLGAHFAQSPAQRRFFAAAQEIARNPRGSYGRLIRDAVRDVDPAALTAVGVNLGYTALTFGARQLREQQERLGCPLPWTLTLDLTGGGAAALSPAVDEARELGIYTYVCLVGGNGPVLYDVKQLCRQYPECTFFVTLAPRLITEPVAESARETLNAVAAVQIGVDGGREEARAFALLHQYRRLYGYCVRVEEGNRKNALAEAFLTRMYRSGCLFGCYFGSESLPAAGEWHQAVRQLREEGAKPLLLLDFPQDGRVLAEAAGSKAGEPVALRADETDPPGLLQRLSVREDLSGAREKEQGV